MNRRIGQNRVVEGEMLVTRRPLSWAAKRHSIFRLVSLVLALWACPASLWAQGNAGNQAGGNLSTVKPMAPLLGPNSVTPRRPVPGDDYYLAQAIYLSGDYNSARRAFIDVARGGSKTLEGGRWVDSICYHTMLGESHYQLGDLVASLEQHNSALQLYLAHLTWMMRVEFPESPDILTKPAKAPTWGPSSRNVVYGRYPDTVRTFMGNTDAQNAAVMQRGGALSQGQLAPIGAMEVLRCIAISLKRRAELLGPTGEHDAFTQTIVSALAARPAPPNHWTQAFIELQVGLAHIAANKPALASSELQRSLLVGGRFEHPMSCIALLELGKLAFRAGQWDAAMTAFMEATHSGAVYGQYDVVEEAFRGAMTTHLVRGNKTLFAPVGVAAEWAHGTSTNLQASLFVLSAENLLAMGDATRAFSQLTKARGVIGRHDALAGQVGARYHFELAKANFQTANLQAGSAALAPALAFQAKGSRRLFHIFLTDTAYTSGVISERIADGLYADVLREPQPNDWTSEPLETLGVAVAPRGIPMEHWFEAVMKRNEPERACEIIERMRRQKFFASLPLGGRLLALRWILAGPAESIGDRGNLQRRDILAKYPQFGELSRQVEEVRAVIAREPLTTEDGEGIKTLTNQYDKLAKLSGAQELLLHDMALQRLPADYSFPPLLTVKEVQARMSDKTLVLAYYNASRALYGFALAKDKYGVFKIESPNKVRNDVVDMLKKMGLRDRSQPIAAKELADDSWKSLAVRVSTALSNNTKPEAWEQYREVVVVPDGLLWYCPFEMLPVGKDDSPLLTKARVRFVPTVSLVVPDGRPIKPVTRTAVVAGRLYPREDLKVCAEAADDLAQVLPDVSRLPVRLPGPSSLLAKFCDRLVVYHDMDDSEKAPYDWSPVQIDQKKIGSSLGALMTLPWGGPTQVVFPGFHTPTESGGTKRAATGDEVFLTVCGLMATGTQTALLSRWRVGGQTSFDLTREFLQELPHESASAAWQRSVLLRMQSEIDAAREPRLNLGPLDEPIRADHPFFWAGYMLVDTGIVPAPPEAQVAK
jgi:hypothetical protein